MNDSATPLHILFLITHSEHGGAQAYVLDLARELKAKGHQVTIAAGMDPHGWLFDRAQKYGISTVFLQHARQAVSLSHDLISLFEIKKLIRTLRPDVIHLNSSKIGFIGSLAARLARTRSRIIYTAHGFVFHEPGTFRSWYGKFLERVSSRWKDAIICVSEFDRQAALKERIIPRHTDHLTTIHHGINANQLSFLSREEARRVLQLPSEAFIIGTVANLYPTKGLHILIEATRLLMADGHAHHLHCVIIGEGPEHSLLETTAHHLSLDSVVHLLGAHHDASRYLKAFDLFVLSSLKEGFPYVLLEALAAGLPIIATRVGGIPEIIEHEKNGILVDPGDAQQLANAISRLINDQPLHKSLAHAALQQSTRFARERMLNETFATY